MRKSSLAEWFFGAALGVGFLAGCSAAGSSAIDGSTTTDGSTATDGSLPLDGAAATQGCNRANFVFLDSQATSIVVTGSFTKPTAWARDVASGALSLSAAGQGAWTLKTQVPLDAHGLYKYIYDQSAVWKFDNYNPVSEPDGQGGLNSVLVARQTFVFSAPGASSVLVTGNFTSPAAWADTVAGGAVALKKSGIGDYWVTNIALPVGRNLYKFIVDGSNAWMPDPINPDREPDGTGLGFNSVVTVCRDQ